MSAPPGSGLFAQKGDELLQLGDGGVDVAALALERRDLFLAPLERHQPLRLTMVADVVEIEKLANFGEAEAGPLAAQNPGDPGAVALRIEPLRAAPLGSDQALILVEAQRPSGDSERVAHLADRIRRLRAGDGSVLHEL